MFAAHQPTESKGKDPSREGDTAALASAVDDLWDKLRALRRLGSCSLVIPWARLSHRPAMIRYTLALRTTMIQTNLSWFDTSVHGVRLLWEHDLQPNMSQNMLRNWEQIGGWILAKKVNLTHAASVCLVGKHWDQPAGAQSFVQAHPHEE
jgi:hypothetical protein